MQDSGHTPEWTGPTVERVLSNGKRIFALAFRRWLVEQTRVPGASVAGLALRHGINANQLRRWMTVDSQISPGSDAVALLPVTIEAERTASSPMPAVSSSPAAGAIAGPIELEVYGARLTLHGEIDPQRLRAVLEALARRG